MIKQLQAKSLLLPAFFRYTGMVIAFEPKCVFPGEGAVGVELDYIVMDDGLERITNLPTDIVSLYN